ncbi:hypothetical protein J2T12_004521 [Paenibacillus anaericanus]|uniref:S-layer homology domain-containing protein n=1 Tax=Paenibacillus anaericanus TaxID=170367 RepID=UPI0027803659|nr:S-layer homology domain-containing protein [Paenibacillus anaericanus]MDQ0091095.1 hypothetical protein [Paenibacillus anaericanus]
MKRFRPLFASLMSLLLILSVIPSYSAQAASGGSGATKIPSGTVMIMNKWKNNYLYEASNGTVRYGMTNPHDESAHWIVDSANGLSRIKNVKTGNYITIAQTFQRHQALTTTSSGDSSDVQWIIDQSTREGFMVISSATMPQGNLVIHEEDQLGFAEASSDINITFESPQWAFIAVDATPPVRIQSNMRPNEVIYEDKDTGAVMRGVRDAGDMYSQWYIDSVDNSNQISIRNAATGNLITQNEEERSWAGIFATKNSDNSDFSHWLQEATVKQGYVVFQNVGLPGNWINPQYGDDNNIRSNNWAGGADGVNALWKIVSISELPSVRIGAYTDGKVATDFLYDDNGNIKYGAISETSTNDPKYSWVVEDYDLSKRIRNVGSNDYLMLDEGGLLRAGPATVTEATYQWSLTESDSYDGYKTIQNVGNPDLYISTGAGGSAIASSDANSLGAQWELIDPSTPIDGSDQFIRIQNNWQPFYLYENLDGTLKYGNIRQDDQRDQWLVVKHNGRKLFQNRETGHYMNIADMPDGHIQVTPIDDSTNVDAAYIWSGKNLGGNLYLISNISDSLPGQFISLQNLTKYAEYSVINPNWGSPQWKFIPVTKDKNPLYRFKLIGSPDHYLNDDRNTGAIGTATYGPADGDYSIWFLKESSLNGPVTMKNQGSGRTLSIENLAGIEGNEEPALAVETRTEVGDGWASIKWVLMNRSAAEEVNIKSGWTNEHYIYATFDDQNRPVFKVSKATGAADRTESIFIAESVQIDPQPIPQTPVRIRSVTGPSYLYENSSGVVLYGDLTEDNGYAHWLISTGPDGKQLIQNRATGHYLTLTEDYTFIESKEGPPADSGASSWSVKRALDGEKITVSSQYAGYDDEFINIQNNTGYAERGLFPDSWGSVQWELQPAPQLFTTPNMQEYRNLNTTTPLQDDTNMVVISVPGTQDKVLAERGGKIVLADASESNISSKWLVQDYNGRYLLKNTSTNHYLALNDKLEPIASSSKVDLSTQWTMEDKLGYRILSNAKGSNGLLLHKAAGISFAAPPSLEEALWSFKPVTSDVTYPVKDAFKSDTVIHFAVNAETEGVYSGLIRYRNSADVEQLLHLSVNGLQQDDLTIQRSSSWGTAEITLNLRAGMNSVSLNGSSEAMAKAEVDSLTVKSSVNKAYRGATVPYISYEAEDMKTNGTLIGPSRKYRSIASEASGRKAVSLENSGDYVEFTLAKPANSLVLRYSIPDSKDGLGADETLSLYIDGVFKQTLNLTSKYAWEYGSYPWSNDPRQGSGHRFFDEIHTLIGDVPQGSTIQLKKDTVNQAEFYVIDLVDMEQVAPANEMPDGFISVTEFGAVANDGIDDTEAFNKALQAANNQGTGVWFPVGTFDFGDELLNLDNAVIRGAGMWYTTLNGAKFFGHGGRIEVYDLLIDGGINERDDEGFTNAFHGAFGPESVIQQVWIEHTKAGLWLTQPIGETARTNGLYMMGLRIRNLMADGINFAVGTHNSMMEQSDIRYPGDDGIAMWSFTDPKLKDVNGTERTPSVNNTARFNTVSIPWLADNIVVFGGKDNKIQDNIVKDTVTNGAGIAVSTRFSAEPFAGTTVVERNTLTRTGSYDTGYGVSLGALWLFAGESDMTGTILVRNNVANDSTYAGLIAHGDFTMKDVLLQNIVIDGNGTNGIDVTPQVKGSATVDNVIVRGDRMKMVSNPAAQFRFNEINQGFASLKNPPIVDPGDPGEPGSGGGQGGNGSGGSSGTTPSSSPTTAFDAALKAGLEAGQTTIELKVGADGNVNLTASALVTAATTNPDTIIAVVGNGAEYFFPLSLTEQILKQAGVIDSNKVVISIHVSPITESEQARLAQQAKKQGIELIGDAKKFTVSVAEGSKTTEITHYDGTTYVERQMTVNRKVDSATTVVLLYDPISGTLSYVPALFEVNADGTTTVTIKSTTNGIFTVASNPLTFSDITAHWAKKEIEQLASRYIVRGMSSDQFAPGKSVSRAEFAAMLVRALDLQSNGNNITYQDVKSNAWYSEAIAAAAHYGLVNGYQEGSFRPDAKVSREEMAVMTARALKLLQVAFAQESSQLGAYKDANQVHAWARADVELLLAVGIMKGQNEASFAPGSHTTRAEAAVILSRLLVLGKLLNP